jgi:farnesyl diphosphate synthase
MSSLLAVVPVWAVPVAAAALLASGVVLVASTAEAGFKLPLQFAAFGSALALSLARLMYEYEKGNLNVLLRAVNNLGVDLQFFLALFVISSTFFGCTFYLSAPLTDSGVSSASGSSDMPASSDQNMSFSVPRRIPEPDQELFEQVFDTICKDIVADLPTVYEMPKDAVDWVENMLAYTVAGGKMNRGLALMSVQSTLAKSNGRSLTNRERVQSAALGWCIEFLQAFFLVADDIMDGSLTRRGQPCWYKKESVGLVAINDSFILESCVFKILKKYFGTEPYYLQLLDLFIEVTRQTELGQLLDLTSQPPGEKIDLSRFSMQRLKSIFKYKTAFYSFYLPVALGMIVSGVRDVSMYNKAREILCIMGEYFQIQDDFLDCFGTPEQIGKVGTDIQDNKNSWLVVTALQICSAKQRQVLELNYGSHDLKKVEVVKKLYRELGMEKRFAEYEENSYKAIKKLINDYTDLPTEVFEFLLRKIYKRSK